MNYKLGKLARKFDARTLKLERFRVAIPGIPSVMSYPGEFLLGHNDMEGDCVEVGTANAQISLAHYANNPVTITDDDCQNAYIAETGYDPVTGANDTGLVELDHLNLWRQQGIFGNKLGAYASVRNDPQSIKECIYLFGGCFLGVELPLTWQGADKWDVPHMNWFERRFHIQNTDNAPGSWGGHCVWAFGYDATGVWVVSWKEKIHFSFEAMNIYCSERYALFDDLWFKDGRAVNGLDVATLQKDLAIVTA